MLVVVMKNTSYSIIMYLYKFRCHPMHPLNGALPEPCVSVRVSLGAVMTHRNTYARPRRRTYEYRRAFITLSASLWSDLGDPIFDGVELAGFKSRANAFLLA